MDLSAERMSVILIDRIGYHFYQAEDGRRFLPADRFTVRLVTDRARLDEVTGDEIESLVALPRADESAWWEGVRLQHRLCRQGPVRLVVVTERQLLPAARLREELGIPGPTVAETLLFRDKVPMKQHLREAGIRVPDFAPFSASAARRLFQDHPVLIAKPRLGAGSMDVTVLRGPDDLDRFTRDNSDRLAEFEVEQFVDGQLYHIDSVVQDGQVLAAIAGHSIDDTTSFRGARSFRDVGVPAGPLLDTLLDFNRRVLAAHPRFTGATHHEVLVRPDGEIYFCEIAARAGGGGVIAGFLSRTGVNLDEAVVQAQTVGTVPEVRAVADHLTGYALVYAGPGTLTEPVVVPSEPWVIEAQVLAAEGDVLPAPTGWDRAIAIVSVRGDSVAEVTERLDRVIEFIDPRVVPVA